MKVKKRFLNFLFFFQFLLKVKSINWQADGWAFGCDFSNRNLATVKTTRPQCRPLCFKTKGCTHYTWSKLRGGSCWMKYGIVTNKNAFKTHDNTMVCGIIVGNSGNPITNRPTIRIATKVTTKTTKRITPTTTTRRINKKSTTRSMRVKSDFLMGLQAHNKYRARHSAQRLTLDNSINQLAQTYAQYLANNQQFKHSNLRGYGENLYRVCGNYDLKNVVQDATDSWYEEVKLYNFFNPTYSPSIGHFTQVVWKSSKKIGFGVALDKRNCAYVVANYFPQGNYFGEFRKNVTPY